MKTLIAGLAATWAGVSMAHAASLTTLANFQFTDGAAPYSNLIADAAGNLFGTTSSGGTGNGTIFEITNTGGVYASTPTTLATFSTFNGSTPQAGLIMDASGNLFGTTSGGGVGFGTVFELAKTGSTYANAPTALAYLSPGSGFSSQAGLIADSGGNLFGTATLGGAFGNGSVFEIAKTGGGYAGTPITIASFDLANGAIPKGSLVADSSGNLFGTTAFGGVGGNGTIFEIAKTGGVYASAPTLLASFNLADGANPQGGLILDSNGDLFGTTSSGGMFGVGTVFELANTGGSYASAPTDLADFNVADGAAPYDSLIADAGGNLFGTASGGGLFAQGTVFELAKTGAGYGSSPTALASFNVTDGSTPRGSLLAGGSGDLFGTTYQGGTPGLGTVFEVTSTGFQVPSAPTDVPEPSTLVLLVTGLTGALLRRKRA